MILLRPIESLSDISPEIRGTPIEDLLRHHYLGATHSPYSQVEVLVGMTMDLRDPGGVEPLRSLEQTVL